MLAPLIKTPPTHTHTQNTTLYTGLILTRGSSAFVVGPHRIIITTYDLDIYKCALQIQQSVVNTNWILQAVNFQSVYCTYCPIWPRQNNCWKWHWHMCHWKWCLNFCSSSWKLWWQYIYMGGIEYHITTNLAIMIVSLMSLYMWYTKEHSLWMKTRHDCILWRCPVWKYGMETRHWGACSVLYAVPKTGDSVLNLISSCQSDDWEDIFVALETSSSMCLRIISLNHPHLQLATPLWPPIPLQPHILHNHPYPITIHTPINHPHPSNHTPPKTKLIPKLRTLQNHPHPSNCPHPSTTHLNHTYPPTTHIPSNHPHLMSVHLAQMNTLEQDDPDTWKALMPKNVVKLNVLFTYMFTDHTLEQEVKMLKWHSWMVGVKMELL